MSHTYEALIERLQQLDKWIAETERVAASAIDSDTRQQIANYLARWRDSRSKCVNSLAHIKSVRWVNRAAAATAGVLVVSFVGVIVVEYFHRAQREFASATLEIAYLILLASFVSYLFVNAVRNAVARRSEPLRFSVRDLLIVMTGLALALGTLVWLMRR